jgi:hypothetical protein
MKRSSFLFFFALTLAPSLVLATSAQQREVNSATVMIANYDNTNKFLGWGSGFFVDDGIVVTNKHVIEDGDWYRVLATDANDAVDFTCDKKITKSDVKVNLDDDVAYMRVYLDCPHGVIKFADQDPANGVPISIVGYRYKGSIENSLTLTTSSGTVTGKNAQGWLETDAYLDVGNSGGPVVHGDEVVGVAVAKGVDDKGNYVTGYFIPSSVILNGLLYANDSQLGYTPQSRGSSSSLSSIRSSSSSLVSTRSVMSSSVSSRRSSARSSVAPVSALQLRTCARVRREFFPGTNVWIRLNERLKKRFGFIC